MLMQAIGRAAQGLHLTLATDLAIDLGTSNTLIYAHGRGVVLNEPSVIAIHRVSGQVVAIGREAEMALGREPQSVRIIKPVRDGVIADFDAAEKMLSYFIGKVVRRGFVKPRVLICAPGELTQVERRAIEDATYRAGASRVEITEQPLAAAVGAGRSLESSQAFMVVDIGGGTTDVAVVSFGGPVYLSTLRVGGSAMDEAIVRYLRKTRGLEVGERTGEMIKLELATARPQASRRTMEVRGRNASTGMPHTVTVTSQEISGAIEPVVQEIVRAVRNAMEELPPEVSADLLDSGIVLTGAAAQLPGLTERIRQEAKIEVQLSDDPASTVALGAGSMLQQWARSPKARTVANRASVRAATVS